MRIAPHEDMLPNRYKHASVLGLRCARRLGSLDTTGLSDYSAETRAEKRHRCLLSHWLPAKAAWENLAAPAPWQFRRSLMACGRQSSTRILRVRSWLGLGGEKPRRRQSTALTGPRSRRGSRAWGRQVPT